MEWATRLTVFTLCILYADAINTLGADHSLRGAQRGIIPAESKPSKLALRRTNPGWGTEPGPVGEKPGHLKKAEDVHKEWFLPVASLKNIALATWTQVIVTAGIWMSLVLIAACVYKGSSGYIPDGGPALIDTAAITVELSEWQSKWYECYRYPGIFAWACFCPCVRWAHNMDLLQFLDYWPAFLLVFVLEAFNQLTAFTLIGLLFTALLVSYRQKTRKIFGMDNYGTCAGYTLDCLGLCLCWQCLIAQEAYHITEAARKGWSKELAVKTGPFSARQTPNLPRYAVSLAVPDCPSPSPSGSNFHTPRQ